MTEQNTFADHATEEASSNVVVDESGKITIGDRTFDSQADLIKSWENGQTHISTLEAERESDREQLTKAATMEEVLDRLQSKQTEQTEQTASVEPTVNQANLTREDVNNMLVQREAEKSAEGNLEKSMTVAKDALGTDYINKLESKARELGMSETDAIELAKKSPTAFSSLFVPSTPSVSTSSFGDINAEAITPREQIADSPRVGVGASSRDVIKAWNAAAPNITD